MIEIRAHLSEFSQSYSQQLICRIIMVDQIKTASFEQDLFLKDTGLRAIGKHSIKLKAWRKSTVLCTKLQVHITLKEARVFEQALTSCVSSYLSGSSR